MRNLVRLVLAAALLAAAAGVAAPAAAAGQPELVEPTRTFPEARVALVVGNADYSEDATNPGGVPDLDNALNDSRAVRNLLTGLGFRVVYGEDLPKREMERAMAQFAGIARGSEVAVTYFAGHGATFGDIPYLVPVDALFESLDTVTYELVRTEDFIAELRKASGVRLALIDACRDNAKEQQLKRRDGGAEMRGGEPTRGLARVPRADGLIIAYATQFLTTASDGAGANSPFATALVGNLPTPGVDIRQAMFNVADAVVQATGAGQRPEISVSLFTPFMLVPAVAAPAAPAPAPPRPPVAIPAPQPAAADPMAAAYAAARDLNTLAGWSAFLGRCRDSIYCDIAAAAREQLQPPPAPAPAAPAVAVTPPAPAAVAALPPRQTAVTPVVQAGAECDRLAANPDDIDIPPSVAGVAVSLVERNSVAAIAACTEAVKAHPDDRHLIFNLGRALNAGGLTSQAIVRYEEAAARGSAAAMYGLGFSYSGGVGVAQNYATARSWYEKAAAAGDARSMTNLGVLYQDGNGVARDYAMARSWYERGFAAGRAVAMHNIGVLYEKGNGVTRDYAMARSWYERSVAAGYQRAASSIGWLYDQGFGVPRDYAQARQWYEKGVAANDRTALHNLGHLLDDGLGGAADRPRAIRLFGEAMNLGYAWTFDQFRDNAIAYSAEVRRGVQQILIDLGYLNGAADGAVGQQTRAALTAFQAAVNAN